MTTQFTPVPTYADPVDVDPVTNKGHFNPIWLKWFLDVGASLSTVGAGQGGQLQHNALAGLQGGGTGEYFHLTNSEHTQLLASLQASSTAILSSIAALRAISKTLYTQAYTTGYYSSGDGGSGRYYQDPTDTTSFDDGCTIIVAADGARWKLFQSNVISVKQAGAKGDGVTNDYAAIQAAVNAMAATGGEVWFPGASPRYLTSNTVTVPTAVRLRGSGKYMVVIRYTGSGAAFAADGSSNNTIQISDLTIDVTANNAVCLDASRLIACSFNSVRFRALSGTGQAGVYANTTNVNWTSYYNVFVDCTFDGAFANAVYLNSSVAQYANRWRFIAPTFLNNINSFNFQAAQGVQVVAPYFDEHTGVSITLGAKAERVQFSLITQETNVGGSLWSIDPACNRLEVFGIVIFAGANGIGSGMGTRALVVADWDTGIRWSGATSASAISTLTTSDDVGVIQTGVQAVSSTTTAGANLCGVNTFPGAATQTITFPRAEPDASYRIVFGISANETIWYSNVTTAGFTAHTSNAASTAQFNWAILR